MTTRIQVQQQQHVTTTRTTASTSARSSSLSTFQKLSNSTQPKRAAGRSCSRLKQIVGKKKKAFIISFLLSMVLRISLFSFLFRCDHWLQQDSLTTTNHGNILFPWSQDEATSTVRIKMQPLTECKCVNCDEDELCGGLWKADKFPPVGDNDLDSKKIHIVVSHCKNDLDWIADFTDDYGIASTHVITKCGVPVIGAPENATIQELPNVGRCDHTYAYYIANILDQKIAKGEEEDSIVFFLKDDMSSDNKHQIGQWNDFETMLSLASSSNGFSCGIGKLNSAKYSYSAYHHTMSLFGFRLEEYNRDMKGYGDDISEFNSNRYTSLGSFYRSLRSGPYPELVQVCYGGVFAASYPNIKKVDPSIWEKVQKVLSRGNNILEGHYMERSWGSLLATPDLQPFQIEAIKNYTERYPKFSNVSKIRASPLTGSLRRDK